jgi:hypothetical protein
MAFSLQYSLKTAEGTELVIIKTQQMTTVKKIRD